MAEHPLTKKVREDLWNNPAKDLLTDEQKEDFAIKGESMYGQMDFETLESNIISPTAYAVMQLRSGLHPSFLTDAERDLLKMLYGDDWESRNYME